ncbi:MAG: M6 family metalloprotease domain-containing protein, partial [candidate division Zixibacteria bacterium]|nr:M6 family metalloprotease domain-containing protein [candidate division Zixibacteria bacterium]
MKKLWYTLVLFAMASVFAVMGSQPTAQAVAPRPGLLDELREQGRLTEYLELRQMARAKGVWEPNPKTKAIRPSLSAGAKTTTYRIPCILVDFSDNPWGGGDVAATPEMFDSLLFSEGINPTGSLKEFYEEASDGLLEVEGVVVGWFRMPNTYAYYMNNQSGLGSYPLNAQKLAEVAIDSAARLLDYSEFDNWPADGAVDGVMIVVPGTGAEETGDAGSIHSHRYSVSNGRVYDGKTISDYTIQPEETMSSHGPMNAIGVFCHEWGHIFDLPDLYDLDQCDSLELCEGDLSYGLGDWSLMALGNWLPSNLSHTPCHFDAWSRLELGFGTAVNVTSNMTDVSIPPASETGTAYRIWEDGVTSGLEYYLVEHRRKVGFDSRLPGQGLLIYHVDESMNSNRNQWIEGTDPWSADHYWVALEQADGLFGLERRNDNGGLSDAYFADSAGFDQLSYPSSRKYSGEPTQVAVWNISDTGSVMTANFDVTYTRPYLSTSAHTASDPGGDGDGIPEQGETFQLVFDVTNALKSTDNISVTVSASGSDLIFNDDEFSIPALTNGATADNASDPIEITVPENFRSRLIEFAIDVAAEGGAYSWRETLSLAIGTPHVLVVDDDRGELIEQKYVTSLSQISEVHTVWDVSLKGTPPLDSMTQYPIVIWMTGDTNSVSPTPASVDVIKQFLDDNGLMLLTGQDILENVSERGDTDFMENYLGVEYAGSQLFAPVQGVAGDPIGDDVFINA